MGTSAVGGGQGCRRACQRDHGYDSGQVEAGCVKVIGREDEQTGAGSRVDGGGRAEILGWG
jgi:hypothetical protein